ncbi:Na/Pi cotransporter family protein [Treponema sp.]|uniref:Na/Pi cotransporter family protein n=1 Tax=Treponema sp. TaxID=166 RepID=UPI00298D96B6|nr:Na/Pi cotransporter family protein [Treponema sp.]MCR5612143.1 Na/Pi cotransporter family protein [Treponema sp.]
MAVIRIFIEFLGALAFLLYGMKLMSDGVQKSAGERLQRALSVMTGNRFVALLTGLVVTMVIQSSGATTVMVVTFVNAGLLTLVQSVGVIFGANIGTTITAWIVSLSTFDFNIAAMAIPIFGLGYIFTLHKRAIYKNIGEALMGFGMLFLGLEMLQSAIPQDPEKLMWLKNIQDYGVLSILAGFIIGIIITALLHSSSAFSGIVISLAIKNAISWEFAAALTLGSNIGSTIDAVLASMGTSADARRSAFIHVLFNVLGTVLVLIFFEPFLNLVVYLTPGRADSNIGIRISMLHTVFKVLSTVVLLPMQTPIIALSKFFIREKENEVSNVYRLEFLESMGKENIAAYIIRAEKAIADMTDIVTGEFDRIQIGLTNRDNSFIDNHVEEAEKAENYLDQMHEQITHYLVKCESLHITEKQLNHISLMIQIVEELENMSDNCFATIMLISKSISKNMKYQQEDMDRMIPYVELARQFLQFIRININKQLDENKLSMATELEDQIDMFRKNLKKLARKRLESGADVKSELLYIDMVRQIEKIGDNCFSISESLRSY